MTPAPGLYAGTLRHRRHAPARHEFSYSLFMALLDIDRLAETMALSRLTGYNRWNWAAFYDRDHVGDAARPLRDRVVESAGAAAVDLADGPIQLLTHLHSNGCPRLWSFRPQP